MKEFGRSKKGGTCTVLLLGAVTALALSAQTFKTLANFNGDTPSSLVQGTDGNFYGITRSGNVYGTVFKITPGGTITTLYTFCSMAGCADGEHPRAGLTQGSDGNFYGTTTGGGVGDAGTIFKITPAGTLTTLYRFCSQGGCDVGYGPYGRLIQGSDGNFYGTTWRYGINGHGTVFKVSPSGTFTTLYTFCSVAGCADSDSPRTELTQGSDGNFYGTTAGCCYGGAGNDLGTIFKITPGGTLTTLYRFLTDPGTPLGGLIQASNGDFYGTTSGITANYGTVFKITPTGTLTNLHRFCSAAGCADGLVPSAALIRASDGNFYGTTGYCCGGFSHGTVFRITPDGALTTLHTFCSEAGCADGEDPTGLTQGADGRLYGTTQGNGARKTVFTLDLQLAPPRTPTGYTCTNTTSPLITSVNSANSYGGYSNFASGSWLEIKGTNLADPADPRLTAATNPGQWTSSDFTGLDAPAMLDGISVTINGKSAYVWYLSPTQLNVQAPEDSAMGNVAITVTNCQATSPPFQLARQALSPGLLAPPSFSAGGVQYMVATFASDGAYVLNTNTGAVLGLNSRPAKPGDLIIAYGIGFGDVTPSIQPGTIVQQSNALVKPITVSFGSTNATLTYAGLAGGFVGLYEFYITVPPGLANGDYQINVTQNGVGVPQTLYLTVHN